MLDLATIKIVLVETSHPGNIGAAARAMKVMGLSQLILVQPKAFPNVNATAMAAGADDILANAQVVASLEAAVDDCQIIFGTSARTRKLPVTITTPRAAATQISSLPANTKVAILFGRENNGLTNEELALCNYHLSIPTDPNFSSLNLAAAVQLIAYELRVAIPTASYIDNPPLATNQARLGLYRHLETTLTDLGFFRPVNNKSIMRSLVQFFNRTPLEEKTVQIIRGILTAVQKAIQP